MLLFIADTHEAPKSLSLDSAAHSSSSCESLTEPELTAAPVQPVTSNGNSSTPVAATNATQSPLPLHPRSAFISYVRRRGEPDGGGGLDSSLANTTDSEHSLSDGYATQAGNGQPAARLGYASLRGPVRVSRPGGGGESDAAFTPSPPVTDPSLSLALAHQTRIRCLYAQPSTVASSAAPLANSSRRPDSSSSASSTTTDWEGSGHATVLRRGAAAGAQQQQPQQQQTQLQQQPPLPPPRPPVYHNLGAGGRSKPKIKLGSAQSSLAARVNKEHALFMDRLSVRTELNAPAVPNGAASNVGGGGGAVVTGGQRKALTLSEEEAASVAFNPASLYFSPADSELLGEPKQPLEETPVKPSAKCIQDSIMRHMNRELTPSISELYHERNLGLGLAPPLSKLLLNPNYEEQEVTAMVESNNPSAGNAAAIKTLVDAVNELELSGSSSGATIPTVVGGGEPENNPVNGVGDTERFCSICGEHADVVCRCKAATMQKKSTLKPWLSNVPASSLVQASELTTAEILERRLETVAATSAPFTAELCRRDEGDGRSVADSQCSSNYKRVLATAGAVSLVVGIGAGDAEAQNTTSPATCSAARLV